MLKGALESCCCRESLGSGEPAVFMQWFVIDGNPGDSQGRMWFSEGTIGCCYCRWSISRGDPVVSYTMVSD